MKYGKFIYRLILISLMAIVSVNVVFSAGQSDKNEEKELRWYIQAAPDHPWSVVGMQVVEDINKKLEGKIKIKLYLSDSLGKQVAAVNMLRTGSLFLFNTGPTLLIDYDDRLTVFALPYVVKDRDHMYRIWDNIGPELMQPSLEKSGIRTITFWDFGTRTLTTKGVEARKPEDLNGVKIRAIDYPQSIDTIKSLGAVAVPVPFSELYVALQTGVTVGQENPIPTIFTNKYYEVQDHIILTNHLVNVGGVFASEKIWEQLDKDTQKIISDAISNARIEVNKLMDENTQVYLDQMIEKGMKLIEPDREAFIKYSNSYIKERYGDKYGEVLKLINEQ